MQSKKGEDLKRLKCFYIFAYSSTIAELAAETVIFSHQSNNMDTPMISVNMEEP